MNNIINLLNLEDKNIEISKIERDDTAKIKYIYVHTNVSKRFCPICDMRMHSRGTRQRTVNHPMLQDGYELIILLKQRRWRCTNPACGLEMNEGFNFVNPRRRFSNASDFLILEAFKDLSKSARAIAKDPKIFIFDDSFSALDLKTDAALRKALAENVKDSTVIIVAQRISTILHAEQILVLDDGRIVGKGTHEELLKNCSVYQEIAKSQLSASELGLNESEVAENEQ